MKNFNLDKIIIFYLVILWLFFGGGNTLAKTDPKIIPEGQLVQYLFDISGVPAVKGVAVSLDGKEIWAALLLNKHRGVSIFSTVDGNKITDIDLYGGGGVEIVFSRDGTKAYISQMETAKVYEIDTKTKEILKIFNTKSSWTKVLEISPDGTKLYASNWLGNNISEFDLVSGKLLRNIKTVKTPRGTYVTKDGKYIYVAGYGKGEIQKINLEDNTTKIIFKSGGAMRHFAYDEEKGILYISDMAKNVIWKLDLATDNVTQFAKTDSHPNTIALSGNKKILFVSNRGHNFSATNYYVPGPDWGSVLLFDTSTSKMLDAIVAGNQPTALDVSGDGSILVFSDFLDAKMEVFKVPSHEELLKGNGGRSMIYKKELIKK